jgi:FlaG/FlaF family flagellin (archaellin)
MNVSRSRAVAVVIGVILMVMAATAMGAVALFWGQGTVSEQEELATPLEEEATRQTELPKILDVAFDIDLSDEGWSGKGLILTVSNGGTVETLIEAVYVEGELQPTQPSTIKLGPKEVKELLVQYDWTEGEAYLVKIASNTGVVYEDYYVASGSAVISEFPGGVGVVSLVLALAMMVVLAMARPAKGGVGRVVARRGVSYIISVMVMALVITTLSAMVLTWSMNTVGSAQSSYEQVIQADVERIKERFVVEHVVFDTGGPSMTVYVRNVGQVPLKIDAVYFNDTRITVSPVLEVGPGRSGSFTVTTPSFSKGDIVQVIIATQRGNTVGGFHKVP